MTTAFAALVVTLERGRDGLEAKTDVPLDFMPGRVLEVCTSKSMRGGVSSNASVMKIEPDTGTGFSGRSCILSQDFFKTLVIDRTARATEKTIRATHALALAGLDATLQAIRTHYGLTDAPPRLCPTHQESLGWDVCTPGFQGCIRDRTAQAEDLAELGASIASPVAA